MTNKEFQEAYNHIFYNVESSNEKIIIVFIHDDEVFVECCKFCELDFTHDVFKIKTKRSTSIKKVDEVVKIKTLKEVTAF